MLKIIFLTLMRKIENIIQIKPLDVKDFHILDKEIFISYSLKLKIATFKIAKAKINNFPLNLRVFLNRKNVTIIYNEKMSTHNNNGKKRLLVTTGSDTKKKICSIK